jgi:hypothetical protein
MESIATPCLPSPADPQPDPPARTMPARIASMLRTVRILLGFGRHLAETATHRSTSTDFNAIAACFGTSRLSTILAHLQRGLSRAAALERVLLARAARGRDIQFVFPRERAATTSPAPADPPATDRPPAGQLADPQAGQPAEPSAEPPAVGQSAEAPIAPKLARPSRPFGWNDPELFMPTPEQLDAQVRRRPLGRTIVDICLDLAVVPDFCTGQFWNALFDSIRLHGGSVAVLMLEKVRREKAFSEEQDKKIGSNWDWQEMGREAFRCMLGFFIGEAADAPFDPMPKPYAQAEAVPPGPS